MTSRPRRIAILGHTAVPGGGELALVRMLDCVDTSLWTPIVVLFGDGFVVQALRAKGIEVHVLTLNPRIASTDRYEVSRLSPRKALDALLLVGFIGRLVRLLYHLRVDAVHTNTLKAFVLGAPAAKLLRRPLVWSVHDRISTDYLPPIVVRTLRWAARHVPDALIVNSQSTLSTLGRMPAGYCTIAYPGLTPDALILPSLVGHRAADTGPPVVGLVGRISPTKGQDVFLRAAKIVLESHPEVRFRVIGSVLFNEAPYEREVHDLSSSLGIEDSLEYIGFVPDVTAAFSELSIAVHASPVPEPFGMVITEAMAAGVPVIATQAGGAIEILAGARSEVGILVPPRDHVRMAAAIVELVEDRPAALEMARRARETVDQTFTVAHTVDRVTSVWGLVSAGRTSARL